LGAHSHDDLDLTPWAPSRGELAGLPLTSAARALAAGLRCRPLRETVRDTLAWFHTLPADRQAKLHAGLDAGKEAELLRLWHDSHGKA
jgi:2'-hydroxyisoflavone reductase